MQERHKDMRFYSRTDTTPVVGIAARTSLLVTAVLTVGVPQCALARSSEASPAYRELAELGAPRTKVADMFGTSVAISGSTIVVGSPGYAAGAGRAYVFVSSGHGWHQVGALTGDDTGVGDSFGQAVAISGGTIVVGAPGRADGVGRCYVFAPGSTGWHQAAELKGSDGVADTVFGTTVAVSSRTVLVGAPNAGRAYVFTADRSGWHQTTELTGPGPRARSGVRAFTRAGPSPGHRAGDTARRGSRRPSTRAPARGVVARPGSGSACPGACDPRASRRCAREGPSTRTSSRRPSRAACVRSAERSRTSFRRVEAVLDHVVGDELVGHGGGAGALARREDERVGARRSAASATTASVSSKSSSLSPGKPTMRSVVTARSSMRRARLARRSR